MKIVIFGSNGMLGKYVCSVLEKSYEIIPITRKEFDIVNDSWNKLEHLVKNVQIVINCAGCIPQKVDKTDYVSYIRVNTLFPHKLGEFSKKYDHRFIHVTTDCVFDGKKGNYTTDDKLSVTDIYGVTKYLGEPDDTTIIRTSIIGEELFTKKSLLEWVKSNRGKTIEGYTNHFWNGVTCLTLAKIIKKMIEENLYWSGVKHVFSPDTVSKYELCKYINEIYDLGINIIPVEKEYRNMTITGDVLFDISTIYEQITEQKILSIIKNSGN